MVTEWKKVKLIDITTILGDGLHGTPKYSEGGEYYFINGNNLDNGRIVFRDNTKRVDHSEFLKHQKRLNDRTILVSINGTLGNVAYYNDEKVVLGKSACYFNLVDNVDKGFVRYVLASNQFQSYIESFATGTTIKNVSLRSMRDFSFLLPSLKEQRNISQILGKLDEKIQINCQTNQTLEAMAQALFKSWFVDFDPVIDNALAAGHEIPPELQARAEARKSLQARAEQRQASLSGDRSEQESGDILPESIRQLFPNRFVLDAQMGWIPEGWEVKPIGQVIENVGGGTPRTSEMTFWDEGVHSFCTPKDMSLLTSKALLGTERHLTDAGVAKISSGQLPKGTVLMSSRAPIGYLAISDISVSVNQGIIAMKPTGPFGSEFIVSWAEANMEEVIARANGSTFLEISKKNFREIPFLVPSNEVLEQYNAIVKPYFYRITNIQKEVDQLAQLRDTLLPKLISGELRIVDKEEFLDEAV